MLTWHGPDKFDVFIFPLPNVVFYPQTSKPLNVFEPRYLMMVQDALAQKIPIALASADEFRSDGSQNKDHFSVTPGRPLQFVKKIAGFGNPIIAENRPDGAKLVLMHGIGKVELGAVKNVSVPYIVCEAQIIKEDYHVNMSHGAELLSLQKILINWLNKHIVDPQHRENFLKNIKTPAEIVGCLASYIVQDSDIQQLVLEANSINEKIDVLNRLILSGETFT